MAWTYSQKTGVLQHDGEFVARGYAGRYEGRNNPEMQNVKSIGPLPQGKYTICAPFQHPKLGPYAMPLRPHPDTELFGRNSFYMHGDSKEHPGLASHGCMVFPYGTRKEVWESADHELVVTA